jgi:hypothetical protein
VLSDQAVDLGGLVAKFRVDVGETQVAAEGSC